ncbi:hypothetical protein VMUT_1017 [Vulcanisaeta moutnovskia 768-28]|uniref:Uncharacterized protein n=1 Tax=Vulcanisaeta moutnovskia (strain 768-28) TaxID=985053 RepID=F0QXR1_VULM7|nr:hypothetical protein [Vulcanisaeta moutnovskia]ADY01224.1 hypothetical protein VMUT_1017 [Vulcanisaeta moutnovskia 768-28]
MLTLSEGLIRRREVYVYGFRSPTSVTVGLGSIALVTKGLILIVSAIPRSFNAQEEPISLNDTLIRGRVRRHFCWDGNFIWPPENVNALTTLVDSGYALVIERLDKPPNIIRIYRRLVNQGLIRAETILNIQAAISTTPTLVGIIEVRELGRGKPFWRFPRPCLAGQYVNNALSKLGVRVV